MTEGKKPDAVNTILPQHWDELVPLLDDILDAAPEKRAQLLAALSDGDQVRRSALEQLLADCDRDAPLLDATACDRFHELLDEPEAALPDILSDRYQIRGEIGRGGMARVYLAHDLKHERDVALKVLRADIAASIGRERFLREISIAARLRHPNIVPLFDSGDDAGALYFVMPYEAGPSLRDKLREGPLVTGDAISVLRDVGRALSYAHEHGIVHRDVKPDNVMLSSGAAVVTDFGIATALHAAQSGSMSSSLLQTEVIGTPAYMAPEQASATGNADHRVDIYSFGCMAYELFAGEPPFKVDSVTDVIAAHIGDAPKSLGDLRADVPRELSQLIARCLEKEPAARPQNASELVSVLDDAGVRAGVGVRSRRTFTVAAVTLLILSALAVGAGLLVSRQQRSSVATPAVTLAVMPFRSAGSDSTHSLFAEGFGAEIASELEKVAWVHVVSRRGVTNYAGQPHVDYARMGRDLGARYFLTGSMREDGRHEIIALRLIKAADGSVQWANEFNRPSAEVETERDEIARSVSEALRPIAGAALSFGSVARPPEHHATGEAYFYQVQAQQWLDRRGLSVDSSAEYFRRAIAADPSYARAYSGLSLALALFPYFQQTPPWAVRNELMGAAHRALELDSTLAQPHVALGIADEQNLEWNRAGAEFSNAIRLDTHDVEARVQFGRYLLFRNRVREALAEFQAARQEDPASALVLSWTAYTFYILGDRDSARVISDRALQSNATNFTALNLGALIRLGAGQRAEARDLAVRSRLDWPDIIYVLAATSDRESILRQVDRTFHKRPLPWLAQTWRAYAMLGIRDTAQALDALERATEAKEMWPSMEPQSVPMFDDVRESPRFKRLLRQVGLHDSN